MKLDSIIDREKKIFSKQEVVEIINSYLKSIYNDIDLIKDYDNIVKKDLVLERILKNHINYTEYEDISIFVRMKNNLKAIDDFIEDTKKSSFTKEEIIILIDCYVQSVYDDVLFIDKYDYSENTIEKNLALEKVLMYKLSYGLYDGRK